MILNFIEQVTNGYLNTIFLYFPDFFIVLSVLKNIGLHGVWGKIRQNKIVLIQCPKAVHSGSAHIAECV